jgi:anti-anti-sigma regulatory factor
MNSPFLTLGETTTVFASDYLNKLSGEKIERECKDFLNSGVRALEINFKNTEIVNSIGISILLGVIDAASDVQAKLIFSEVSEHTVELFEMLGLNHRVVLKLR